MLILLSNARRSAYRYGSELVGYLKKADNLNLLPVIKEFDRSSKSLSSRLQESKAPEKSSMDPVETIEQ